MALMYRCHSRLGNWLRTVSQLGIHAFAQRKLEERWQRNLSIGERDSYGIMRITPEGRVAASQGRDEDLVLLSHIQLLRIQLLRIEPRWHFEERTHHVPELLSINSQGDRVGGTRKSRELSVRDWKLAEEILQILLARNAVVFTSRDKNGRLYLQRVDNRQFCRHVEIGAGRN